MTPEVGMVYVSFRLRINLASAMFRCKICHDRKSKIKFLTVPLRRGMFLT